MKKFLALSAAVVFLAACSKDTNPVDPTVKDSQITLTLKGTLPPNAPASNITKSDGSLPTQANDNTVGNIMVFVFNSTNQTIDQIKVATPGEITSKVVTVPVSSGARDIYVAVNYPANDYPALSTVTNVSDLRAIVSNLRYENEGDFCMIGKKLNQTIAPSPTANNINVVVSRLVARVTLANITTAFTGGLAAQSLNIDSVYILNAIGTKSYADSSLIISPATIYNSTDATPLHPLFDRYAVPVAVNNTTAYTTTKVNGNHYYVYANPANTYAGATKLVITGLLNGVRTYYPIAINVAGNGYTPATPGIAANSQYSITVNLRGYGNPATDPGYLNQIQAADATITVTPANWHTVINQSVDF